MKHDWKKTEKKLYLPKGTPELIQVPELKFFSIEGKGNPNEAFFADYIGVLYALSYGVKMSPKQGNAPEGYFDYSVYPLEGVWDLDEESKKNTSAKFDKNALVFKLMIRQPEFVTESYAREIIDRTKKKKPHPLLEKVCFETIEEGPCIQMLHTGSYDSEPESFRKMEAFAHTQNIQRVSKKHREIYLSDARKTVPEKLKTVLRFNVRVFPD